MTYPDEMFEEAERREKENKVLDIAKNIMEENKVLSNILLRLKGKNLPRQILKISPENKRSNLP